MNNKYKTFHLTTYHRGVEIVLLCVTSSKKKFAEIVDMPLSYINKYVMSYDLRYSVCNENPNVLFVQRGLGGESRVIFKNDDVIPYEEAIRVIDDYNKNIITSK
jgi:hypothetical protein